MLTIKLDGEVNAVANYVANGRQVLLIACGNVVRRFDAATGKEVIPPLEEHTCGVRAVCDLGGGHVLTGSLDKTARVWTPAPAKPSRPSKGTQTRSGLCAIWAVARPHRVGRLHPPPRLNTRTGKTIQVFKGHTNSVRAVCDLGGGQALTGC